MENFLTTAAIAFVLFLIALALLGVSWIVKGKLSIKPGACGQDPTRQKDGKCGKSISCILCEKSEKPKEKPSDDDELQ